MRHVNWDLLQMKSDRLPEDVFSAHVERLTSRPAAIRGRPAPRWEEMSDAEVAEAVGLSEEDVRLLEERCAPEVTPAQSSARSSPKPDPGGG